MSRKYSQIRLSQSRYNVTIFVTSYLSCVSDREGSAVDAHGSSLWPLNVGLGSSSAKRICWLGGVLQAGRGDGESSNEMVRTTRMRARWQTRVACARCAVPGGFHPLDVESSRAAVVLGAIKKAPCHVPAALSWLTC